MTITLLVVGVFFLLLLYGVLVEPNLVRVTRVQVCSRNLPPAFDGIRLVHLSDIHCCKVGAREKRIAQVVRDLRPDTIACTGDLFAHARLREECCIWLKNLCGKCEVFMVVGNHDVPEALAPSVVQHYIQSFGVQVLRNEALRMCRGEQEIIIAGVDDGYNGRADTKVTLANGDDHTFTILLAHTPDVLDKWVTERVDLVLSGHTHGGQVRLPVLGAVATNTQRTPRRMCAGLSHPSPRTNLYVSRGLGSSDLPVRFLCLPEVVLVTLRRVEEE